MVYGLSQSIWQSKVPSEYQGRVFSSRRMIAFAIMPLSMVVSGPLADRFFEPAMRAGGVLAPVFSAVTGTGPGAGMAVMFLLSAVGASAVTLAGFALPALRNLDKLLPDHAAGPVATPEASCGEPVPEESRPTEG